MDSIPVSLENWPMHDINQPVFNNTQEALTYAQFIWDNEAHRNLLIIYLEDYYLKLKHERESIDPDILLIMIFASRTQYLRECLEECSRIKLEKPSK